MTQTGGRGPSWTVLIVDDEPQILKLLVRAFERAGHRALGADNGDDAAALLAAHAEELDLLLLDVVIPPSGAEAVLKSARSGAGAVARYHLVLTSGDELPESLRVHLDTCGGHFVRKPFAPRDLLERLRGWLDGDAPGSAPSEAGRPR